MLGEYWYWSGEVLRLLTSFGEHATVTQRRALPSRSRRRGPSLPYSSGPAARERPGPGPKGAPLAKQDDTAPSDLRDLLVMLRDALGQPPVGALLAAMAIRTIRMLAEQDLGKRLAMCEQIQAYLVDTWGE
jgi:hypothetical protein